MERRNFFKSLFAAGMVIAAPKILDVNPVEAELVEIVKPKLAGVDAVFKSNKHKGTIFYDGKVIANFNDVEINTRYNIIDTSTLYIEYTPGYQETTIKVHAINVDYELSQTAFFSDSIVELSIQVDNTEVTANGYLESMSICFEEHRYSEWDIRVSGAPTATINHGG
jgi:hypothetical protein